MLAERDILIRRLAITAVFAALASPAAVRAQLVETSFLYKLSSTTGVIPTTGLKVDVDPVTKETIVVGEGRIRIFNRSGMETYSFGDDPELGGDHGGGSHRRRGFPAPLRVAG